MNSFYTEDDLKNLGLKKYGTNVLISKKCSIYTPQEISVGNNVRIDDFCILSGEIEIGNYVHISAYNALYGKYGIKIGNFCGISPGCTLLSASDDFSGNYMISPLVSESLSNTTKGKIILNDYAHICTNSVVMPSVVFEKGAVCGAFSFVNKNLKEWTINAGIPAHFIKNRNRQIEKLAKESYGKECLNCMHNIQSEKFYQESSR